MRNALATLLIIPGVVLFVMAAVALVRFRSRGAGLAFMATRRAAVLSLGMSLAVCSAGSAVAPTDQASVANLSSTDTSALVPPTTRKAATSTVRVTTTSTTSSTRNTVTTFRVAVTTARVSTTTGKPDAPSTTGKPAYVAPLLLPLRRARRVTRVMTPASATRELTSTAPAEVGTDLVTFRVRFPSMATTSTTSTVTAMASDARASKARRSPDLSLRNWSPRP